MNSIPWKLIMFIVTMGLIHAVFTTPLEKDFVQQVFRNQSWTLRPTSNTDTSRLPDLRNAYGMPSGHASFAGLTGMLAFLSLSESVVPWWACALYITLISVQRVLWKRHTALQVVVGAAMGIMYAIVYSKLDYVNAIILALLIVLIWIMINIQIARYRNMKALPPSWAATTSIPRDSIVLSYVKNILSFKGYGHLTWKQLEALVDMYAQYTSLLGKYDAVLPGDQGAKVIGPLFGSRAGVPYYPRKPQNVVFKKPLILYTSDEPPAQSTQHALTIAPNGVLSWPWSK